MYIIRGLKNLPEPFRGAVVTIGNFDGVHLGHQALIHTLKELARLHLGAMVLAITFEPHPQQLLNPALAPLRISGLRGKTRWLALAGVDGVFILRFNKELAALTPENFVKHFLVQGLGIRELLVGENFRFGAGGRGNLALLDQIGQKEGFGVHISPLTKIAGEVVSSSRVRQVVANGELDLAQQLLGHPFEIEGRVVTGHGRGRDMGFPTANISLSGLLHPPSGVYIVEALIDHKWLPGVANLGHNPTFGADPLRFEAHLLADCGNIYRRIVRFRLCKWLRPEIKFADRKALCRQIDLDIAETRTFFLQK
ncbi:MAG: riboflavin biosynthesis protein RibF [Magnetococcus sp. DMHC-6]